MALSHHVPSHPILTEGGLDASPRIQSKLACWTEWDSPIVSAYCRDAGCHASGGQVPLLGSGFQHPHQIFFPEIPELTACPPGGPKEGLPGLTAPNEFCSQATKVVGTKPGEWPLRRPVLS